MVVVGQCTPDTPECRHENFGRVWHGRHGKGAMRHRREGKLAPYPGSRDARVLAREGK